MQNHDQNDHKPPKQSWILYAKLRKPSTDVSLWPDSDTYSFIPSASRCKRLIGKAFSYEIRLANSSCSARAIQSSIYATSFHRLSVPITPGSHTLLSTMLSHVFPLCVTLSPLEYPLVLPGCSHSGIQHLCPQGRRYIRHPAFLRRVPCQAFIQNIRVPHPVSCFVGACRAPCREHCRNLRRLFVRQSGRLMFCSVHLFTSLAIKKRFAMRFPTLQNAKSILTFFVNSLGLYVLRAYNNKCKEDTK